MAVKLYRRCLDACGLATGFVIAAMAVLVTADVTMRSLGWGNLPWLLEVTEYALYAVTFLAAPWVLSLNAHVRVDILVTKLAPAVARAVEIAMNAIGLAASVVLVYYGWLATVDAWSLGSRIFKQLIVPEWWLLWIMPCAGVLLAVEFALRIARAIRPTDNPGAGDA